jgi:transposase InsO family protein
MTNPTDPYVKAWVDTIEVEKTKDAYRQQFFTYWTRQLAKSYPSPIEWIRAVRAEQKSDENNVRVHWALDLKSFMQAYISPRTHKPFGSASKSPWVSTVLTGRFLGQGF